MSHIKCIIFKLLRVCDIKREKKWMSGTLKGRGEEKERGGKREGKEKERERERKEKERGEERKRERERERERVRNASVREHQERSLTPSSFRTECVPAL